MCPLKSLFGSAVRRKYVSDKKMARLTGHSRITSFCLPSASSRDDDGDGGGDDGDGPSSPLVSHLPRLRSTEMQRRQRPKQPKRNKNSSLSPSLKPDLFRRQTVNKRDARRQHEIYERMFSCAVPSSRQTGGGVSPQAPESRRLRMTAR